MILSPQGLLWTRNFLPVEILFRMQGEMRTLP